MFSMLLNLTKAAVSVALAPVALAADVVTLPKSAMDGAEPFDKTASMLANAVEHVSKAID